MRPPGMLGGQGFEQRSGREPACAGDVQGDRLRQICRSSEISPIVVAELKRVLSAVHTVGCVLHQGCQTVNVTAEAVGHPQAAGVAFLLATHLADGSWYVPTRSHPTQIFIDSGFPHGASQFISAAATNWATLALVRAQGSASTLSPEP